MPYSYIEENKLLEQESVFPKKGPALAGNSTDKNSQASMNSVLSVSIDEEDGKVEKQDKVEDFLF
jgi:hypothetical protein